MDLIIQSLTKLFEQKHYRSFHIPSLNPLSPHSNVVVWVRVDLWSTHRHVRTHLKLIYNNIGLGGRGGATVISPTFLGGRTIVGIDYLMPI